MTRPSQKERVYAFLEEEYRKNGFSPSIQEIALHLGLTAKSNIHRQLQQLVTEGRLVNLGGRYVPAAYNEISKVALVPVLGTVAAGQPILAVENMEGHVAYFPRSGDSESLFALKIKGDSMIGAGIFDGDLVVVDREAVVHNGDIAVALIDDEATVKTFYRENGHVRLQPENPSMQPILVKEPVLLGRVLASMRYH